MGLKVWRFEPVIHHVLRPGISCAGAYGVCWIWGQWGVWRTGKMMKQMGDWWHIGSLGAQFSEWHIWMLKFKQ